MLLDVVVHVSVSAVVEEHMLVDDWRLLLESLVVHTHWRVLRKTLSSCLSTFTEVVLLLLMVCCSFSIGCVYLLVYVVLYLR